LHATVARTDQEDTMATNHAAHLAVVIGVALAGAAGTDTTEPSDETESTTTATPVIDPGDGGNYAPEIDPASFVDVIDNRYFPLTPGTRWVYEGGSEDGPERIEVEVLDERRDIQGISATIVRDTVYVEDVIAEDTYDWYAQDADGNVWYLGEDSTSYEEGEPPDTSGSWEYGIDGALPGIIMLAHPAVGDAYREEYYPGEAEDLAEILEVGVTHSIGLGDYDDVVVTQNWSPLEPEVVEQKWYAPGVGVIAEADVTGAGDHDELVEFVPAD
jgi:hypothetical protein